MPHSGLDRQLPQVSDAEADSGRSRPATVPQTVGTLGCPRYGLVKAWGCLVLFNQPPGSQTWSAETTAAEAGWDVVALKFRADWPTVAVLQGHGRMQRRRHLNMQ